MPDPNQDSAPWGTSQDWLKVEWTALANDLDQQADRLEQFVESLRQRAVYARQKAKEAERG